ncbi:MAG: polysaccharide deacetylase family protein [Thermomicrobiales bacterium]|nr:polysaccharide deacetylase family protein [Thermomicrobiales bacterium]
MSRRDQGHPGALVISLDFELRWGVHDLYPADGGAYRANLLGVRAAIPRMLDHFEEYGISATWATVGMLMTESREEWERFRPAAIPNYADPTLDTYRVVVGESEAADPLHFAMSLVDQIRQRPGQEIGSHTYAHYCALEPGSDAESYRQDIAAAVAIAKERGITLRSLVPPRHQFNPDYARILSDAGFTNCRSNAAGWLYKESHGARYFRSDIRAGRLIDHYIPITSDQVFGWDEIPFVGSLCCLPASFFLRAYSPSLRHLDGLRFRRIARGITNAARQGGVFHLWWHPHNAGAYTDEYLALLRRLLDVYADCRARYGMVSMSMAEAAETASRLRPAPTA